MNITIWNEFRHEKQSEEVQKVYPNGIHMAIKEFLSKDQTMNIRTATLDEEMHGLSDDILNETDVLLWWGHMAHDEVCDELVEKIHNRVLCGMGLIILHSAHFSKIFKKVMGTTCSLKWREVGENERLWVIDPNHPIARGLGEYIDIPHVEMYGERFDIPTPDELVFISWFKGGEVFRSGCCYKRGLGKIFYFKPGHETFPIYHQSEIQQVIINAVNWANPINKVDEITCPNTEAIEEL